MKLKSLVIFISLVGILTMGCTDRDPGVCRTKGQFDPDYLSAQGISAPRDYVRDICRDWVNLFTTNCISVDDLLSLDPVDIALYCDGLIHTDDDDNFIFEITHACNFVDNNSCDMTAKKNLANGNIATSESAQSAFADAIARQSISKSGSKIGESVSGMSFEYNTLSTPYSSLLETEQK